jgi:hypothetical protein
MRPRMPSAPPAHVLARPRHRRAAEVQRAPVQRAQRLDAVRVSRISPALSIGATAVAISTRGRSPSAAATSAITVGSASAARRPAVHDDPHPHRIRASPPSAMRSVPEACSGRGHDAIGAESRAAARTRSSSVATITDAAPLACAHSQTHWISGRPPIASKGLPGRRERQARRYDDVKHGVRPGCAQRSSSGSSAPSTRASSGSITGIPSRTA